MENEKELQKQVSTIQKQIDSIVISNKEDFEIAGRMVLNINEFIKKVKYYWKDPVEKAHAAHKALTVKRAEMLNPLEKQKTLLNRKINTFLTEEENKRKEEQRKLDEQRRKQEEAERKRLEERARKAEEKGKTEKAEELREKAEEVFIPQSVVQPEVEKTVHMESGTASTIQDIDIRVLDEKAVLKHIIDGTLPVTIVSISLPKLKSVIKLHQIERLDGVSIEKVSKARFRAS